MEIKVYDEYDKVVKTCKAETVKIKFGFVRNLMKLLNVDNIDDTSELLKTVYGAWEELISLLDKIFPDMEEADWDNVEVEELLPLLIKLLKDSFKKMLTIPSDSKN